MALQLITKNAEVKLLQMLAPMRGQAQGWQAVHFHLSDLLDEYKSEYQVKIAINLLHDVLKGHEGSIFVMTDSSILLLCNRLEQTILDKLIFQLRYLYMDDPLAYNESGQENPAFCTLYDLRHDWHDFYDLASNYMALATRKKPIGLGNPEYLQPQLPAQPPQMFLAEHLELHTPMIERAERQLLSKVRRPEERLEEKPDPKDKGELSVAKLVNIERNLRVVDLQSVIRRQPVCAVLSDMQVRHVFDELYIHIAQLRQVMKSEVNFFSNRWLFKHITHILDERMIDLIRTNSHRYLNSPISLNLNVETLLSSRFAEFDASIPAAAKVSIVIEVPAVDMFADMAAFMTARKEVQKLGYRVCLDGLTTDSFLNINREKLGLDLVKVQWNADAYNNAQSLQNTDLISAVLATGTNRVILCRCDNKSAIEYGQAMGISLFQGRYLDSVLNPTSKVEN